MEARRGYPVGGGGAPWAQRETGDLIAAWGEMIQTALRTSRRKGIPDGFQRIAGRMAGLGHRRSALECRAKIAALRVEYRRVFAHNCLPFEKPQTCPFYSQLDRILHGDGLEKPFKIVSSLRFQTVEQPDPPPTITGEDRGASSTSSVPSEMPISETVTVNTEEANKTLTEEVLETPESQNSNECQNAPAPPPGNEPEAVDDEMGKAQLSPASCVANGQTKRRCVSGLGERMVAQPSKQREEKPRARGKEHKEVRRSLRNRCTVTKK